MEYKVSDKIQKKFDTLTKDAKVQKALQFMENDQNEIINRQIELTLIPAPTNHEQKKAARLLEMFKEEGLTDCHIDEYGNCIGIRKGTGGGKTVLVEGHMDTVFPLDTKLEIVREDGFIKCPGIVDDTRGCAAVTAICVIYNANGTFREYYYPKLADHTFINTAVIADSPYDLLWAGIGDALSKECEAVFSSKGKPLSHTPLMGVQLSKSVPDASG